MNRIWNPEAHAGRTALIEESGERNSRIDRCCYLRQRFTY